QPVIHMQATARGTIVNRRLGNIDALQVETQVAPTPFHSRPCGRYTGLPENDRRPVRPRLPLSENPLSDNSTFDQNRSVCGDKLSHAETIESRARRSKQAPADHR